MDRHPAVDRLDKKDRVPVREKGPVRDGQRIFQLYGDGSAVREGVADNIRSCSAIAEKGGIDSGRFGGKKYTK
jgi:hypothetical protein